MKNLKVTRFWDFADFRRDFDKKILHSTLIVIFREPIFGFKDVRTKIIFGVSKFLSKIKVNEKVPF